RIHDGSGPLLYWPYARAYTPGATGRDRAATWGAPERYLRRQTTPSGVSWSSMPIAVS
ncbi:MAG: hypothetical protein ACI8WY_003671, partial [Planctomycetota bacterium]